MKTLEKNQEQNTPTIHAPTQPNGKAHHTTVIVIGGGQSGLGVGYYLRKHNIPFVILDANSRTGDTWRNRWDTLKLFTPARYNGLPGMRYPADGHYFPTKNEMADFLERYARTFDLPVINNARVNSLTKENSSFVVQSSQGRFEAENVVVAMANYQQPKVPAFASKLNSNIVQFHSYFYRNTSQVQQGDVLLVGAGNSGSEIAMELSKTHKVYMSGRDTGHIPFRIATKKAKLFFLPLVLRLLFHRIFTINTIIGRKLRSKILSIGGPLIRVKPIDLKRAGVERVPKTKDIIDGKPVLEDGRVLEVKNVIWCTGYHTGFSWIKLPVLGKYEPLHRGGIVPSMPGLYFTGLHFLYSMSSGMVQGVSRDAGRIVSHLMARRKSAA